MALTRITTAVIEDDAITSVKMSNLVIDTAQLAAGAVTADKMAANAATDGPMSGSINKVQDNVNIVQDNVAVITDTTTDLTIQSAGSGYFFDKSFTSLGINNTAPRSGTISLGTPANIVLVYNTLGGNVIIAAPVNQVTTPYRLDVRGSANVGLFQAERANISSIVRSKALRSNAQGYIKESTTTDVQLSYSNSVTSDIQTQLNARALLAGSTFTGEVTMNDDLFVDGNLTVHGDNFVSNTTSLLIHDPIIALSANTAADATQTYDTTIMFNQGKKGNTVFFYDVSEGSFRVANTADPETNTSISPITNANLIVGNIFIQNSWHDGIKLTATATEFNYVKGVTSLIQTQLNTGTTNTGTTYNQLNANINVVSDNVVKLQTNVNANVNVLQDNVDIVQDNVAALSGAIQLLPFENVVTIASTANTFFVGKPYYTVSNVLIVTLDGINQSANLSDGTIQDFIVNATSTDASIVFTAPTIPIGTTIKTVTLFGG